jgi:hypothetical protein
MGSWVRLVGKLVRMGDKIADVGVGVDAALEQAVRKGLEGTGNNVGVPELEWGSALQVHLQAGHLRNCEVA